MEKNCPVAELSAELVMVVTGRSEEEAKRLINYYDNIYECLAEDLFPTLFSDKLFLIMRFCQVKAHEGLVQKLAEKLREHRREHHIDILLNQKVIPPGNKVSSEAIAQEMLRVYAIKRGENALNKSSPARPELRA